MELAYKYSYIGKTMCLAVFYLPIFPLGVVIAFLGLFLMYLIEKYNVLYHYRRPEKIDGRITREYISTFRLIIFIYAISVYVFLGGIYEEEIRWELIAIVVFGILLIVPYGSLLSKVGMFQVSSFSNDKYQDLYFEMGMNYAMANPLTKTKGFETYLDKLREKNMITEEEYTEHIVKIHSTPSDILELYYKKKYGKLRKNKNMFKGLLKISTYNQGKTLKNDKNYLKKFGIGVNRNKIFGVNFDLKIPYKSQVAKGLAKIINLNIPSNNAENLMSNLNDIEMNLQDKPHNNLNNLIIGSEVKAIPNSDYDVNIRKNNLANIIVNAEKHILTPLSLDKNRKQAETTQIKELPLYS